MTKFVVLILIYPEGDRKSVVVNKLSAPSAAPETIEDLRNYQISLPNGDTVPLSNLGTVSDSSSDPRQMALRSAASGGFFDFTGDWQALW
jgi:multidrug efflux pump subunit AcrB